MIDVFRIPSDFAVSWPFTLWCKTKVYSVGRHFFFITDTARPAVERFWDAANQFFELRSYRNDEVETGTTTETSILNVTAHWLRSS